MNLESILFLLNFLQVKPSKNNPIDCQTLQILHSVIECNDKLPIKIHYVLNTISVSTENCNDIQNILRFNSISPLVFNIQKSDFLMNLLDRRSSSSSVFYEKWFLCFLIPNEQELHTITTDRECVEYQQLLRSWTNCFMHDRDMFLAMMMKIDIFIAAFPADVINSQYLLHFIHHMVNLCFQEGNTFSSLKQKEHSSSKD